MRIYNIKNNHNIKNAFFKMRIQTQSVKKTCGHLTH